MPSLMGTYVAYKFVKQLSKPWKEWEAYKLGLIDGNGNTLKPAKTKREKEALDLPLVLMKNIKKLVSKLPFGKTRLGSIASAMWLLKEELGVSDNEDFDSVILENINILNEYLLESDVETILFSGKYKDINDNFYVILEDTPAFTECIGVPLFKVKNTITRDIVIVSKDDLIEVF